MAKFELIDCEQNAKSIKLHDGMIKYGEKKPCHVVCSLYRNLSINYISSICFFCRNGSRDARLRLILFVEFQFI